MYIVCIMGWLIIRSDIQKLILFFYYILFIIIQNVAKQICKVTSILNHRIHVTEKRVQYLPPKCSAWSGGIGSASILYLNMLHTFTQVPPSSPKVSPLPPLCPLSTTRPATVSAPLLVLEKGTCQAQDGQSWKERSIICHLYKSSKPSSESSM